MAEFCLECWNKINNTNDGEEKYVISKELDLCEGCEEWKNVIICERQYYNGDILGVILSIFSWLWKILHFLLRLFSNLGLKIKKHRSKKHPRD